MPTGLLRSTELLRIKYDTQKEHLQLLQDLTEIARATNVMTRAELIQEILTEWSAGMVYVRYGSSKDIPRPDKVDSVQIQCNDKVKHRQLLATFTDIANDRAISREQLIQGILTKWAKSILVGAESG